MSGAAARLRKARAFFLRDLRMDLSYRFSFLVEVANVLATVTAFYFLATTMGDRIAGGYETFPFLLLGMSVNSYVSTALYSLSQGIRGSQGMGVLKTVLGSPVSPGEFLFYSSLYPVFRAAVDGLVYLAGGVLLGISLSKVNVAAALIFFVLSVASHAGIGILSATLALIFKKGDPLIWVFGSLSWLLGGVFYNPQVMPPWMQGLANLFPLSHALRGTRAAILEAASLGELLPEILVLGLFVVLTVPLGVLAFQAAVRRARRTGSLGHS